MGKQGMDSTLDMLPTFAALAGAKLPTDRVYDGKDLMPFIDGDKPAEELRQTHFWRNGRCRAAIKGDWKIVWSADKKKRKALLSKLGIVHEKGRKVTYAERDDSLYTVLELYNLADDPMESKDLSKSHPEKVQEMIKAYRDWAETIPKWDGNTKWDGNK
jgi:arylsulfatase A-like enzyme